MIIKGKFFRGLSVALTIGIAVVGFIRLDYNAILGKAVCFSVVASAPEGLFGFFYPESKFDGENVKNTENDVITEVFTPNSNDILSENSVSVAVKETVIGNIIKKTLTPYNANTKYSNVYISNNSGATLDIAADLKMPLGFKVERYESPQVLIYHTHATEAFMKDESQYLTNTDEPRSTDTEVNIVKIGEVIAEKLNEAGYSCIHVKTLHDSQSYSGSYNRSAETVKEYLKKYPSIKIVIDVHRDSITTGKSDKVAPIVTVNGKEAAQVMLVMGSQTGSVTNYPNWRQNLRLAVKLQSVFETEYPQFARSILLRSSKYNQNLSTGSILIEVGSDANTLEQALYSAQLTADALITLLKEQ